MTAQTLLLLLIVLACPLMMVFMMRGGHGHGAMHGMRGDARDTTDKPTLSEAASLDELRSQRDALDDEIAKRESAESARPTTAVRS